MTYYSYIIESRNNTGSNLPICALIRIENPEEYFDDWVPMDRITIIIDLFDSFTLEYTEYPVSEKNCLTKKEALTGMIKSAFTYGERLKD